MHRRIEKKPRTGRLVALSILAIAILAAGGYFAWGAYTAAERPEELVARLENMSQEERRAEFESMRERRETMSEEERERMRDAMHQLRQREMDKRLDEYFNAPEEERQQVLDRHIDEMQAFWERMRAEREARGPREGDGPRGEGDGARGEGDQARGEGDQARGDGENNNGQDASERRPPWGRRTPPTVQERKERMEGSNPDQMARMSKYFRAMRARAAERGIEMGGRHGRGGRGHS